MISDMSGIPIPYTIRTDSVLTYILLACFFISAYILANNKKYLWQQSRNFLLHKDRSSIFVSSTSINRLSELMLILQTCILAGICFLAYFEETNPILLQQRSPHLLLVIYTAACVVYLLLKWLVYLFLGWVFFDKNHTNQYLDSYTALIYYTGFVLFAFVLVVVYFGLNLFWIVTIGLFIVIFAKILLFYKWIKFFFNNIYGLLLLILYFCALEIIPCFVLYKCMTKINLLF